MRLYFSIRRWQLFVSAAILLSAIGANRADQVGNKEVLQKSFNETNQRREKLFSGEEQASKADANLAKAVANYYIHRISNTAENPVTLHKDFASAIGRIEKSGKNRAFVDLFAPALVASMKEVLANNNVKTDGTVVVNAAMMLPAMARLQHHSINDYLASLVQDEKETHDAVRHYALKAVREVMPIRIQLEPDPTQPQFEDFNDPKQNARRLYDQKNVDALAKYINRPLKVEGMTQAQIDVIRYLRREAIVALAQTSAPAVSALKKPMKMDGLVAPTLMKVLAGSVQPPPSLSEKIEAALGLCAMRYPNMPEYNPDVANFLIGRTLLEFTTEYNKDLVNFAIVGAKKQLPLIPFKGDSNRLTAGLKLLAENAAAGKVPTARASADQLILKFAPIATNISTYKNVGGERVQDLNQYVNQIMPKELKPFKNLNVPAIQLAPAP
ncbi:MAG: hypothetical protein EXR98_05375 [Gemmataceae bacterium]|nr:hypothetical protein [Gemmataceae bacterium]